MTILLVTDAFPPVCGGSGWSTFELARGLRARGHAVLVVKVLAGSSAMETEATYDGLRVIEFQAYAPGLPGVRNYFKNERLYARLAPRLEQLIAAHQIDIVHGQHVLSVPPSVEAARRAGIPSVATVRDYWPICYRSDLMHTTRTLAWCPGCSHAAAVQAGRPTIGVHGLAMMLIAKYLRSNLDRKQRALASADAVIAVSSTLAADLKARAPLLAATRIDVIPNPVNADAVRARVLPQPLLAGDYALYVGKLAPNKGTQHLIGVAERAHLDWPLVIVGDGPDRAMLEREAATSESDVRFVGWQDPVQTATWMAHASMLIFPSHGPESLSRVLIEASGLGLPIAAMRTGGTGDIITDEVTGLLSATPDELARDVKRLRNDGELRRRLGKAAALNARDRFDASAVVARIDALYTSLLGAQRT
ncbi:MAG TPA: glycosyltransferase family 4 protein [Vicinamibacterales bacterium]|nr:glycosyltransferase family 4 protein [Vicinamibacterales bacterium]